MKLIITIISLLLLQIVKAQTYTYDNQSRLTGINYIDGNKIEYGYDKLGNRISQTISSTICPTTTTSYMATLPGTQYQWQVKLNATSNYTSIADNNFCFGSRLEELIIRNPANAMIGSLYRCAVTLDGSTTYSPEYELRIKSIWKGGADSSWANPANWECGLVPVEKTDVIIPKGVNSPVLSQDTKVESIHLKEGEVLQVRPGVKLIITGKLKE